MGNNTINALNFQKGLSMANAYIGEPFKNTLQKIDDAIEPKNMNTTAATGLGIGIIGLGLFGLAKLIKTLKR